MSQIKFEIPKTYEEALERKKQILDSLNKYNEDLLLGNPSKLTDEEVENLRDEFEILDDHYLTKEEKTQYDVVPANPKKITLWVLFLLYMAFSAFISFPYVFVYIGAFMVDLTNKIFKDIFSLIVYIILIGLVGVLNCFITYMIYHKVKNKEDKKILMYFLIAHVAYFVICFTLFILMLYQVIKYER